MTQDSYVKITGSTISYVGPDAVALQRAAMVRAAICLYLELGQKIHHTYGVKAMCRDAAKYTHQTYPASRRGLTSAAVDLTVWIDAMKMAMPVIG